MSLFKYMSREVASLFARTLRVRFTQPFELNDPFELRPMLDLEGTAEEFREFVNAKVDEMFGTVDGVLECIERQIASDPKFPKVQTQVFRKLLQSNPALGQQLLAEMERHKAELVETIRLKAVVEAGWGKLRDMFGQAVGIFSLSEDAANTLMWSHYASQHRGVVVEFDESHPWFNQRASSSDDLRHLVRVCYVQNPQPRTWKQVNAMDMLYTKTAEWAYEREWRIIRPLTEGNEVSPGTFCFDVSPDAVRSIIFGCRTDQQHEQGIRASVATNPRLSHIRFNRAKLVRGKIGIEEATSLRAGVRG